MRINFCHFVLQSSEKDVEIPEIWKGKRSKTIRSSSPPHNAFKRWRKSTTAIKSSSESKITNNNSCSTNAAEEDMSLLKFLAIVSTIIN